MARQVQQLKLDSAQVIPDEAPASAEGLEEFCKGQAYLAEEREQEQWDCETILTTYSTLDNHPSLIKETGPRSRKKKEKKAIPATISVNKESTAVTEVDTTNPGTKIVIAGKLGLPKVVLASSVSKSLPVSTIEERAEGSSSEETDDESAGEEESALKRSKRVKQRKGETAEEKKLRKQKVKEERRNNRVMKKQVKQAFSCEHQQHIGTLGRKQDIDNVSVYKYK